MIYLSRRERRIRYIANGGFIYTGEKLIDGSPLFYDIDNKGNYGLSVFDREFGHPITPIAYAVRHFREFWR